MNPRPDFHRPEPEMDLPTLGDVLNMLAKLHATAPGTHEFDQLALALSAADVEGMEGIVLDGSVYDVPRVALEAMAS